MESFFQLSFFNFFTGFGTFVPFLSFLLECKTPPKKEGGDGTPDDNGGGGGTPDGNGGGGGTPDGKGGGGGTSDGNSGECGTLEDLGLESEDEASIFIALSGKETESKRLPSGTSEVRTCSNALE